MNGDYDENTAKYNPEYALHFALTQEIERFARATAEHFQSLSELNKIASSKIHPDYVSNNLHQQSGFSAEVKHVARNNSETIIGRNGRIISRTDNLGHVNHTSADVVSIDQVSRRSLLNKDGSFVYGAQMKVHKDEKGYRYLYQKKEIYEKYKNVDLLIPADQFESVLKNWDSDLLSLEKQRDTLLRQGKADVAEKIQHQIDQIKDVRQRAKKSTVSTNDAMDARINPEFSVAKDILDVSHRAGLEAAKMGGMLGGGVSFVSNVFQVAQSKIEISEATTNILLDAGKSAASAYVIGATSTALAGKMQSASSVLINNLGKNGIPNTIIQSGGLLAKNFLQLASGKISTEQFVAQINQEGMLLATSMAGSNLGAIIGTVALPGVGTVIGGLVGGMVASMLSGSLYAELKRSIQSLDDSNKLRKKTEEICSALIQQHRYYQQEIQTVFGIFFSEKREEIQSGLDAISTAVIRGESIHNGLDIVAKSLGRELKFSTTEAFSIHISSGRTLDF